MKIPLTKTRIAPTLVYGIWVMTNVCTSVGQGVAVNVGNYDNGSLASFCKKKMSSVICGRLYVVLDNFTHVYHFHIQPKSA